MSIIKNEKADQSANQSAHTQKKLHVNHSTAVAKCKEDYMIQVPISVYAAGIRALATLSNVTAILAADTDRFADVDAIRLILGLDKKGDK